MTIDKLMHLFVGAIFFYSFTKIAKLQTDKKSLSLCILAMLVGTWVPDWDSLLGIGHRSPLTHSALPAVLLGWIVAKRKLPHVLIVGFSIGLSSHLFMDIVFYGNVLWISGGNSDRLFLLANGLILLFATGFIDSKRPKVVRSMLTNKSNG